MMEMNNVDEISDTSIRCKIPKKILHFSDGTMEEFSSDEEEGAESQVQAQPPVDESTMTWSPWIAYKAYQASNKFLAACDYVGEGLAYTFGVTSPKYNYEIEQFKKSQAEQAIAQAKPEREKLASESNEVTPTTGNADTQPKY